MSRRTRTGPSSGRFSSSNSMGRGKVFSLHLGHSTVFLSSEYQLRSIQLPSPSVMSVTSLPQAHRMFMFNGPLCLLYFTMWFQKLQYNVAAWHLEGMLTYKIGRNIPWSCQRGLIYNVDIDPIGCKARFAE